MNSHDVVMGMVATEAMEPSVRVPVAKAAPVQIAYRQGFKYKLAADYIYGPLPFHFAKPINTRYVDIGVNGFMVIREGYSWDGATGVPDSNEILRGSLIHDVLYQLIREGFIPKAERDLADLTLRNICMEDGMVPNMAELVYQGVKLLGNTAADPSTKDIFFAPLPQPTLEERVFPSKEAP